LVSRIWEVQLSNKTKKNLKKLPKEIVDLLSLLRRELKESGPIRGNWKNYSKLGPNLHHCHLKKGRPTYVACWKEDKDKILIEVYYVGTHEKAPY